MIQSKDGPDIPTVLNSPAPYDDEPMRYNFQDTDLSEIFHKSETGKSSEPEATNPESGGSSQQ